MGKMYEKDARAARARRRASIKRDQEAKVVAVPQRRKKATPVSAKRTMIPSPIRLPTPKKEEEERVKAVSSRNPSGINWESITEVFGSCISAANLAGLDSMVHSPISKARSRGAGIFACAASTPSKLEKGSNDMLDLIATPEK